MYRSPMSKKKRKPSVIVTAVTETSEQHTPLLKPPALTVERAPLLLSDEEEVPAELDEAPLFDEIAARVAAVADFGGPPVPAEELLAELAEPAVEEPPAPLVPFTPAPVLYVPVGYRGDAGATQSELRQGLRSFLDRFLSPYSAQRATERLEEVLQAGVTVPNAYLPSPEDAERYVVRFEWSTERYLAEMELNSDGGGDLFVTSRIPGSTATQMAFRNGQPVPAELLSRMAPPPILAVPVVAPPPPPPPPPPPEPIVQPQPVRRTAPPMPPAAVWAQVARVFLNKGAPTA